MAYKDEYEVARLYGDPAFRAKLAAAFDGKPRLKVLLAPPLLSRTDPATGRPRKMAFGPWIFPVFRLLAKLKRLRGTRFDPFGWSVERTTERALIEAYAKTVETLLGTLSRSNLEAAITIAALPMRIQGFGPVKAARIKEVKALEQKLLGEFREQRQEWAQGSRVELIAAE